MSAGDSGFLARWSQRKVQARQGGPLMEAPAVVEPVAAPVTLSTTIDAAPPNVPVESQPPAANTLPSMDEVATLTPASDFSRFVARGVEPDVKNAALKKLFADPHFNLMDGLDTYIEDFGRADPLPASRLAQMAQARFLGLISDTEPEPAPPSPPTSGAFSSAAAATDEDPDLRLQPDDTAGRPGPEPGVGGDAGRQP